MKNKFFMACLCLWMLSTYFACEKDDSFVKEENANTTNQQLTPTIKDVSLNDVGETFSRLKTKFLLDKHMQLQHATDGLAKSNIDTLALLFIQIILRK